MNCILMLRDCWFKYRILSLSWCRIRCTCISYSMIKNCSMSSRGGSSGSWRQAPVAQFVLGYRDLQIGFDGYGPFATWGRVIIRASTNDRLSVYHHRDNNRRCRGDTARRPALSHPTLVDGKWSHTSRGVRLPRLRLPDPGLSSGILGSITRKKKL